MAESINTWSTTIKWKILSVSYSEFSFSYDRKHIWQEEMEILELSPAWSKHIVLYYCQYEKKILQKKKKK